MQALLEVIELCDREEVQIWKIGLETRFPDLPYPGCLSAYLPKERERSTLEDVPEEVLDEWNAIARENEPGTWVAWSDSLVVIDPELTWDEFALSMQGVMEFNLTRIE